MSIESLHEAFRIIDSHHEKAFFAGARPEHLVRAAELRLGVIFPPTYREFLLRLGAGSFGGSEFYGVIDGNFEESEVPNGVWLTLTERREVGMSGDLVIVGSTGDGGFYCLEAGREKESPVIVFQPGVVSHPRCGETVAADFGDFLLMHVRAQMPTPA
jgi:hypothetical protein